MTVVRIKNFITSYQHISVWFCNVYFFGKKTNRNSFKEPTWLIKTSLLFQPLQYGNVELAFYWQSWLKVERHGCSHGFHATLVSDSWLSTGLTVLLCVSTASSITLRMAWKAGSVSGVSGVVSDGSCDRSKSRGGWWYVTWSDVQKHTCVWKQAVAFSG